MSRLKSFKTVIEEIKQLQEGQSRRRIFIGISFVAGSVAAVGSVAVVAIKTTSYLLQDTDGASSESKPDEYQAIATLPIDETGNDPGYQRLLDGVKLIVDRLSGGKILTGRLLERLSFFHDDVEILEGVSLHNLYRIIKPDSAETAVPDTEELFGQVEVSPDFAVRIIKALSSGQERADGTPENPINIPSYTPARKSSDAKKKPNGEIRI